MIKNFINKVFGKQDKMSFKAGFDLTELPIVTFYQGEKKFNFLLDTGSNNCIIDKNILKKIKYERMEQTTSLMGLEGQQNEVGICEITLSFNGKDYSYSYLIKDMKSPFNQIKKETGVNLHGILGSNFFNTFKYVLDFDELIAYSKQ